MISRSLNRLKFSFILKPYKNLAIFPSRQQQLLTRMKAKRCRLTNWMIWKLNILQWFSLKIIYRKKINKIKLKIFHSYRIGIKNSHSSTICVVRRDCREWKIFVCSNISADRFAIKKFCLRFKQQRHFSRLKYFFLCLHSQQETIATINERRTQVKKSGMKE